MNNYNKINMHCCSLYYVIGNYLFLLVANIAILYLGVQKESNNVR